MVYVKWFFILAVWGLVAAVLHYTLPQHDVVRITDTYETRVDYGENALFWASESPGMATDLQGRDVFFIQSRLTDGRPMIYRNEDTGWGWPPYFKFDSANLQADAADLKSTQEAPRWVVVRHYGWRNELLSIYPNAVHLRLAAGPEERIVPWLNIVILVLLAALVWGVWVRWRRFRRRRLDPVLEEMGDSMADVSDGVAERLARLRRWWKNEPG
ncbi:DUF1523 family protein [Rhodosalinus sediminis]|uniref:DUF1523 family protein n=1 Tax=Rhodosalinus sediminis TaxID=1940533 RepID=A0A3D9BWP4_9RHOB|nr:DUF1523 family protein [Rhodosalinus sediminis]REC57945.1 DUF1523 family protein [Rhodosalinus sediminis]